MAYSKAKVYAMIAIAFGLASTVIGVYVLASCEFYQVTWTSQDGLTQTDTPGIFLCKFYDSEKNPKWDGPINGFDTGALIGAFGALCCGIVATLMIFNAYWRCLCRVQNTSMASCLYMMATILQGMTAVVLLAGACAEAYAGTCSMLTNGWLSVGAAGGWFLASCFNRETATKPQDIPR